MTVSFDQGLFFLAVEKLIGRTEDEKVDLGWDGLYFRVWVPKNRKEEEHLCRCTVDIARWMKLFDLEWPESRLEYGKKRVDPKSKDCLEIIIQHKVKKEG